MNRVRGLMEERQKYKRNVEMRYVSAYLNQFYHDCITKTHILLGSIPDVPDGSRGEEWKRRMMGAIRRWADGIAITPEKIILIEGKLIPARYLEGLGKLQIYGKLVPATPELRKYVGRTIEPTLLVPIEDPTCRIVCVEQGIRMVIWSPAFVRDYMETLPPSTIYAQH